MALPLMAGIVIGWHCGVAVEHALLLMLFSLAGMAAGISDKVPQWLFGLSASLFMLASGMFAEEKQEEAMASQWSGQRQLYSARLVEEPLLRDSTVKVLADVSLSDKPLSDTLRRDGRAFLYFKRSPESELLKIGDIVDFEAVLAPFRNAGNPAEFDIESFYYIKGINGSAYIGEDNWIKNGEGELSLQMRALNVRKWAVEQYRGQSFRGDDLALLSALTVGEKGDFPKELREEYSAAGASHVLALSGLHLGIFYMLIVALMPIWGRNRMLLVLRECAVALLLWGFAFVAGLSPSVVRAAILFTLMSVGRCIGQESSSLSSLSFAAIVMLLFSPHLLFDISFQLSFAAVLAIVLLAAPMQRLFNVESHGRVYSYFVNMIILSIAAQIGTLPFIWHYFGVFPLYFLLTNLFVIPLAFLLVALSVAVWATALLPVLQAAIAQMLGVVASAMNGGVAFVAGMPGASLELPPVGVAGACCVALLLAMLSYSMIGRKWWMTALSLFAALLLVAGIYAGGDEMEKGDHIVIYNNRKNPLLHAVKEGGGNYLLSTVPECHANYEYASMPYVKRGKLSEPLWADSLFHNAEMDFEDGRLLFAGLNVRLLDSGTWRDKMYSEPTDIVILCRGFKGSVVELLEVYPTGCIVLDASLFKYTRERVAKECATQGIEAVDIYSQGAMKVVPTATGFKLLPMRGK
ncbi:MAG: ComEC family competence protein [Bacteroidaceae bacterium]|nr:ComEC family competence protein [Bacteroidaceae bacterium]